MLVLTGITARIELPERTRVRNATTCAGRYPSRVDQGPEGFGFAVLVSAERRHGCDANRERDEHDVNRKACETARAQRAVQVRGRVW